MGPAKTVNRGKEGKQIMVFFDSSRAPLALARVWEKREGVEGCQMFPSQLKEEKKS